MFVKQISVFVENKSGRLAKIAKALGDNNIDIQALCVADTTDFGILRLIVNSPLEAVRILKEQGLTVRETEVIAVAIDDRPGGLAKVLSILDKHEIAIEYMYAFTEKKLDSAMVILRVEDNRGAVKTLTENGVEVIAPEVVYSL